MWIFFIFSDLIIFSVSLFDEDLYFMFGMGLLKALEG